MAYSIQRDVSNGSLQYLEVRIEYFAKEHLSVYIAERLVPQGTTPEPTSGYCWTWDGNRIKFNKAVANGLEVMVRRATPIAVPFHIFRQGAVFKDLTVDENFLQQLYINQENQEGQTTTDFYSDLNFHGYRLRNVGAAIHDYDAVPFSQYKADAMGAMQQRILAEQARERAVAAETTAVNAKNAASVSADAALASQNAAKASETQAKASENAAKASESAASASANLAAQRATEATAQATRANSEANRAWEAANTAIQPVVEAMVPFPDVWIPFNDDLRMLAGRNNGTRSMKINNAYAEVQDGATVSFTRASTATYIDKSGTFRTAVANEPRFEKQGLLIEGQSTNLRAMAVKPVIPSNVTVEDVVDCGMPEAIKCTFNAVGSIWTTSFTVAQSGVYTYSLFVKKGGSQDYQWNFGFYNVTSGVDVGYITCNGNGDVVGNSAKRVDLGNGWVRLEQQFTLTGGASLYLYFGNTGSNSSASIGKFITFAGVQIEPLSFASSYIPTNGAAATRVADECSVQTHGSVNPIWQGSTFSLYFDIKGDGTMVAADTMGFGTFNRYNGRLRYTSRNGIGTVFSGESGIAACTRKVGYTALHFNGQSDSNTDTLQDFGHYPDKITFGVSVVGTDRPVSMHIRNFRIWHHALTDAQIKALK